MIPYRLFVFLAFLIMIPLSYAQEFAPIGSEWHYTERFAFSGDVDYLVIKSVKDTLIKERQCKQLDCDRLCWNPSGTQYANYKNDSLFFYDSKLDSFQLISDFNAQKGDSWPILIEDWDKTIDTVRVIVDSTSSIDINGNDLRVLFVNYHLIDYNDVSLVQDYYYPSKIIELIGDTDYFFNFPNETGLMCDANRSGGLRCYEDSNIGFYTTGIADSCTYTYKWTGIESISFDKNINVFPNPTDGIIHFDNSFGLGNSAEIYNLDGKIILTKSLDSDSFLDLTDLPNGVYILILKSEGRVSGFSKIIKN
jgi:hypothetical protein